LEQGEQEEHLVLEGEQVQKELVEVEVLLELEEVGELEELVMFEVAELGEAGMCLVGQLPFLHRILA